MTKHTAFAALLFWLGACAVPGISSFGGSFGGASRAGSSPSSVASSSSGEAAPALDPEPAPPASQAARMPSDDRGVGQALDTAFTDLGFMAENEKGGLQNSGASTASARMGADAEACRAKIHEATAAGYPTSAAITVHGFIGETTTVTLATATGAICDPLAVKAPDWDARVAKAHGDENADREAPYRAAGIGGDKLELATDYHLHGVGGIELAPAAIKRASVLFVLYSPDGRTSYEWTLDRYTFAGDKQVSVTSEGFATRPGPSKFR